MTVIASTAPNPVPNSLTPEIVEPPLDREFLIQERLHSVLIFIGDSMLAERPRPRPRGYVMTPSPPAKT